RLPDLDAHLVEQVAGFLVELGGVQQRLGRNAPDIEAGAAEGLVLLHHGHFHAELRRADGAEIAAGPGADDDEIVGHDSSHPSLSCPGSTGHPSAHDEGWIAGPTPAMTCQSQIQYQPLGILQDLLHAHQERHRLAAVDDAVVVGEREVHHRTDLDLAGHRHRPLLNLVHAEDAGLRRVEDRRRHQRAVYAAVGNGEGAALHLLDLERAVARAAAEIGDLLLDLRERLAVAVAHHGNHQALLGPDRDADVIVVLVDEVSAVDLGVDGGDFL